MKVQEHSSALSKKNLGYLHNYYTAYATLRTVQCQHGASIVRSKIAEHFAAEFGFFTYYYGYESNIPLTQVWETL